MKRIIFLSTFVLSITLSNCVRKTTYVRGMSYLASRPKIESEVLRLERVAIADTTLASISGEVFGIDSTANTVTVDTLIGAVVCFIEKNTGKVYGSQADIHGKYHCVLPASMYDFKIQSIAYNTLIVQNVIVGTGDIIKFDALLGASGMAKDSSVFVMKAGFKIE